MGRARLLNLDQATELRQRYALWLANCPKKLCEEYGIKRETLTRYIRNGHKRAS